MPPHEFESQLMLGGLPATSLQVYNTPATSSNKRKMAPGLEFEDSGDESKKARGQASHPFHNIGPWDLTNSTSPFTNPFANGWPNVNPWLLSSTLPHDTDWTAPDSKATEKKLNDLQNALTEATKGAALVERNAAECLKAKDNAERQLQYRNADVAMLAIAEQRLIAENHTLSNEFRKLEIHTKNCETATDRAQKEAQRAKGRADHQLNSQKGQLMGAYRRYEAVLRQLQRWTEKYGSVERPSEEKAALLKALSDWKSKAKKAWNEISALKAELQEQRGVTDPEGAPKADTTPGSIKAEEEEEEDPGSAAETERKQRIAAAEAKAAAEREEERDALRRMLREEMGRNAALAESLVLRNARLAESLGRPAEEGGS